MKWSGEIPTVPGLYYWRAQFRKVSHIGTLSAQWMGQSEYSYPIMLELVSHITCSHCNHQQLMEKKDGSLSAMRSHGQWAGPIPMPEEA
jgi:hypothetical protein